MPPRPKSTSPKHTIIEILFVKQKQNNKQTRPFYSTTFSSRFLSFVSTIVFFSIFVCWPSISLVYIHEHIFVVNHLMIKVNCRIAYFACVCVRTCVRVSPSSLPMLHSYIPFCMCFSLFDQPTKQLSITYLFFIFVFVFEPTRPRSIDYCKEKQLSISKSYIVL